MDPITGLTLGFGLVNTIFGIQQGQAADNRADDIADAQNEYNEAMYEYDLDERDRLYDYAMNQTNIARNNTLNNINYQEQTAIEDWKFEEAMSIRNYNAQVDAFNKSERIYEDQLKYNTVAAQVAYAQNAQQLADRELAAQFSRENLEATLGKQLADSSYSRAGIANSLDSKRKQTGLSKALKGVQLRSQQAETAQKIQDSRMDAMAKGGRLMARGQSGNSIRKAQSSIENMAGLQQARLVDGLTRFESEYKLGSMKDSQSLANFSTESQISLNKLTTADAYANYAADRGRVKIDETVKSAQRAFNSDNMKIANDLFAADLKADAARRSAPGARIPIPKPLELPRPDIQDPYKPGDPPEPIKNAGSRGINTLGALAGAANNLAGLNWGAILNKPGT